MDGICHDGESKAFDFDGNLGVEVAVGVELLKRDEEPALRRPHWGVAAYGRMRVTWPVAGGLEVVGKTSR